jgi:hypothetical protein
LKKQHAKVEALYLLLQRGIFPLIVQQAFEDSFTDKRLQYNLSVNQSINQSVNRNHRTLKTNTNDASFVTSAHTENY